MRYLVVFDSSVKSWKENFLNTLKKNSYRLLEIKNIEKDKESFYENYLDYIFVDYKNEIVRIKFCSWENFLENFKEIYSKIKDLSDYKNIFFQEKLVEPCPFFKALSKDIQNCWVIGDGINFIMKLDYFLSDEKIED